MGAVAVGVGELAPETERPIAAAPMHVVRAEQVDPAHAVIDLRESAEVIDLRAHEERLARRDGLLLEVEAARLRRRGRRSARSGGRSGVRPRPLGGTGDSQHAVALGAAEAVDLPLLARSAG
jgi:hypothetical protein